MRHGIGLLLLGLLFTPLLGCEPPKVKEFDGPTVDKFVGKLVHEGKPVQFPEDEVVTLQLMLLQNHRVFGIPIKSDGSFDIGWMPIGKYAAILERRKDGGMRPDKQTVTADFRIEKGKTEYTIDLGANWKP
jgi:hypothetical protein